MGERRVLGFLRKRADRLSILAMADDQMSTDACADLGFKAPASGEQRQRVAVRPARAA